MDINEKMIRLLSFKSENNEKSELENIKKEEGNNITLFPFSTNVQSDSNFELKIDIPIKRSTHKTIFRSSIFEVLDETQEIDDEASKEKYTKKELKETETKDSIINKLMNIIRNDKEAKKAVDTNNDGRISNKEINTFLESVDKSNNAGKELSSQDIMDSINKLNKEIKAQENEEAQNSSHDILSLGGAGELGGMELQAASAAGGKTAKLKNNNNSLSEQNTINSADNLNTKDPSRMNLEQVKQVLPEAKLNLNAKQSHLTKTIEGKTPALLSLSANVENAFNNYQNILQQVETIKGTFSKEITKKHSEINNQKNVVDKKEVDIENKESEISDHKSKISNLNSNISNLKSKKSTLENQLSSKDANKQSLRSRISNLLSKITELERKKQEEENQLHAAEQSKSKLESEKNEEEAKLREIQTRLNSLENQAQKTHPEIREARETYNNQKESFNREKMIAINIAKSEVANARLFVSKLENRQIELEYSEKEGKETQDSNQIKENELNQKVINKFQKNEDD